MLDLHALFFASVSGELRMVPLKLMTCVLSITLLCALLQASTKMAHLPETLKAWYAKRLSIVSWWVRLQMALHA